MFYSLPVEVQFDVLKCLNFNQLFSFKQTNFYSLNLINKYENGLARMYFTRIKIAHDDLFQNSYYLQELTSFRIIAPESVTSEFILNDQLEEKVGKQRWLNQFRCIYTILDHIRNLQFVWTDPIFF
uniref:F-box domain-containing protein n=1 Tax=Meloidogyne enterolobii TaxID=390850 RepID=A0A6V7ULM0_MELEN|nr:unnamed protein product [Meloidogyne enterolobii]